MKKYICTVCEYIYDPNKEIRKAELNQEQHLKTFQMIGLVHYAESAKKILNRTKDKTKRERIIKRRMAGCIDICPVFFTFGRMI